jgi:tubulin polyglutamylase TTLL4
MHKSGLARFCTRTYDEDGPADDVRMHLTNFSLNKEDTEFVRCQGSTESIEDSKWSLDFWMNYMRGLGVDADAVLAEMERVTVATVIAGMMAIRKTHRANVDHRHTSHELYGIDIMLDENLKANLIEINISPSLSGLDSELDQNLKLPLNLDVLRMGRIIECDATDDDPCPAVDEIDEACVSSITPKRQQDVVSGARRAWVNPVFADFTMVRDFLEETDIQSGFRLVYPTKESLKRYSGCFDRMMYHDVVFAEWIAMDGAQRKRVLTKHFHGYRHKLEQIIQSLAEEEILE